jgi:hypothetical protein
MKTKNHLFLFILFSLRSISVINAQISEVYIMASPSLRNSTTVSSVNNQKSENKTTRKITVVPIIASLQFNITKTTFLRVNYYYQSYNSTTNMYYNIDKSKNNYSTYDDVTKNQKIQSAYFDILKKKNYNQIQFYYGLWLGGYNQTPFSRISSRTNFINGSQDEKQISQNKYPSNYGAKIGIVISTYFKIYKGFYVGLEMRNAIDYNISKGTEEQRQSVYDAQNRYVDSQITQNTTNSKQTSLQLFNSFISLKYTLSQLQSKTKNKDNKPVTK